MRAPAREVGTRSRRPGSVYAHTARDSSRTCPRPGLQRPRKEILWSRSRRTPTRRSHNFSRTGRPTALRFALTDDLLAGRFFSIDVRGQVTGWNPRAEAAFGWSTHHVSGQSLFDKLIVDGPRLRPAGPRGVLRRRRRRRRAPRPRAGQPPGRQPAAGRAVDRPDPAGQGLRAERLPPGRLDLDRLGRGQRDRPRPRGARRRARHDRRARWRWSPAPAPARRPAWPAP